MNYAKIALWLIAVVLASTWAFVFFVWWLDAPVWFATFCGVWAFDKVWNDATNSGHHFRT